MGDPFFLSTLEGGDGKDQLKNPSPPTKADDKRQAQAKYDKMLMHSVQRVT
ncbi:hypothetical protein PGH07_07890 [Sulfurovum sp. zt1-1]|uniref:Uncharacterized protein n=1 Tax=Sulfurovum zhangzhouensis TaxID=3019067 RepID=A0ABT7QZ85_9BACT|nr:hypothetical protein [Sulfurovum zhangzhouensis]MDM5272098.1 hypothetical protein [Sulfurovum zhangzhouensis]